MAEYLANAVQDVALNSPVIFSASIPCTRGYIYHEDESGIFILRGIVNNPSSNYARYQVTFNGNIAIPAGGAITPIALAISVEGEPRLTSRAIYTPVAAESYGNITSTALITVPKGCCVTVSVRSIDASTSGTTTPAAPLIEVQNANLVITRVA